MLEIWFYTSIAFLYVLFLFYGGAVVAGIIMFTIDALIGGAEVYCNSCGHDHTVSLKGILKNCPKCDKRDWVYRV